MTTAIFIRFSNIFHSELPSFFLGYMIINYAVSHHVQQANGHKLWWCTTFCPIFLFTGGIFNLKTVSKLSGFNFQAFHFAFTNLIRLRLENCSFGYQRNIGDPFASCLSLKNISLRFCNFLSPKVMEISAIQLLNLEILGLGYMHRSDYWIGLRFLHQSSHPSATNSLK